MSCRYETIELSDLGLDLEHICESHIADAIYALADTHHLPIKLLTRAAVVDVAQLTYYGIRKEHRADLLEETMIELDQRDIVDAQENVDRIIEIMQNIATEKRYALAED